ncbi:T9SS type A sorting domain-containing protein [Runella sp. CRIBMP]|uniref:T9SS type A sorting domain-containing protein n=1 Tax=Runella sp. CRIBMP TaxID=2683261 RepID=UPI00141231BB|nr:T9SS type A sorting domain-containing protein [Runella sp. CRIBMP]NBB19791.1 T9SS type A sorting domain-containing protein [Runella sp. CRIBMP]
MRQIIHPKMILRGFLRWSVPLSLCSICVLIGFKSFGQTFSFRWDNSAKVLKNNAPIVNPWAGGLNSAQFSKMHLNDDGTEDLVIFDRGNQQVSTFLAVRQANAITWQHAPQYEAKFPSNMLYWMLLVDYDRDGRKDLFTSTVAGIRVFRNIPAADGFSWSLVADPLLTQGFSGNINLYVPSTDLPAITDVDDDGDIDILTFDFTGASLELHQNLSKEQNSTQPFVFRKVTTNWGRFAATSSCDKYELNLEPADTEVQAPEQVRTNAATLSEALGGPLSNAKIQHAGNTLWVGDIDGDGRKDILHGHVACDNLTLLKNVGGNGMAALIGSVQSNFPAQASINYPIFPSAYIEDLDGDGIQDLVASPSSTDIASNSLINLRQSNWFYRNEGTVLKPNFVYRQPDFLQDGMIDLGENATPALADIDGDGDLDLVVGYGGARTQTGYRSSLQLYRNTGTATQAQFELVSTDFLNLSNQLFSKENLMPVNTKPFFADLNGDGTLDLGFWANTFKGMDIRFVPNKAPRGAAMQLDTTRLSKLPNPTNFSNGENLLYYDIDQDGNLDVLVSKNSGNVEFHRNTGSTLAPVYELKTNVFGGLDVDFNKRSQGMAVADLNGDRKPELVLGDLLGRLRVYQNFTTPNATLKRDTNLIFNEFVGKTAFLRIGAGLFPAVGDLDGDQLPELLIGSNTGGIKYLKNTSPKVNPPVETLELIVYPNPTSNFLYAQVPVTGQLEIITINGQIIKSQSVAQFTSEVSFDVSRLAQGIYFIRLIGTDGSQTTRKVVIAR